MQSLHVDHGFLDLLLNCLQRIVRGIKHIQGSASSTRLSVTDSIMLLILYLVPLFDHRMFRAACLLAYFSFLRASEFQRPTPFAVVLPHMLVKVVICCVLFKCWQCIWLPNLANHCHAWCSLHGFKRSWVQQVFLVISPATASASEELP